jgi:peptidyl-prolyl cis-trans isomerase C
MNRFAVGAALVLGAVLGALLEYRMGAPSPGFSMSPPGAGEVVARWNGGSVTLNALRGRLDEISRETGVSMADPGAKRRLADDWLRTELLAEEARRRGLLADGAVLAQLKQSLARRLIERDVDGALQRQVVSEADLKKYYDEHVAEFVRPEKVHAVVAFFPAPSSDAKLRARRRTAVDALRKAVAEDTKQTADGFATEVRKIGPAPDRGDGLEDPGPLSRPEMEHRFGADFTQATWLLVRLGEVSAVIETPAGFRLARLQTRLGAVNVTFDQAKETIRSRVWYQHRSEEIEKFVAEARRSLAFEIDQPVLEKVVAGP